MISVIIPVYNAEVYLRRCLNSVVCQTYSNMEVILVDDGSTDASGEICEEYAKNDKRIKVVHEENSGVSAARNMGLRLAQGNYICFIDADDEVGADYLQYLHSLMMKNKADISACSVIRVREGKERNKTCTDKEICDDPEKVFTRQEALKNMIYKKDLTGYSVAKLYKKNLIWDIYFDEELKIAEDFAFVFDAMEKADKIVYGDRTLYKYYQNTGSCMHDNEWEKYQMTWHAFTGPDSKYDKINDELAAAFTNYLFIGALGFYTKITANHENEEFLNTLIMYVKKNAGNVLKNRDGKQLHRVLALLCCINGKFGCEVCKIIVRLNGAFNIQMKKTI